MYREIEIKGEIPTEIMNQISELCGNRDDMKLTLKITYEDFTKDEKDRIVINGINSFLRVYHDEYQLMGDKEYRIVINGTNSFLRFYSDEYQLMGDKECEK